VWTYLTLVAKFEADNAFSGIIRFVEKISRNTVLADLL